MNTSPDYYPIVIISDTHLGIMNKGVGRLTEFLNNVRCDTLILNGDIIDGMRRDVRHNRHFSEKQAQLFDLINRKIAEGMKVFYLPGNHDIKLRNQNILGKTILGLQFAETLEIIDPQSRRLLIAHGDQFDTGVMPTAQSKLVNMAMDYFYATATNFSAMVDNVSLRLFKRSVGLSSHVRTAVEARIGRKQAYAQNGLDYARAHGYDGVICGHFHMPDIVTAKDGTIYRNSGDWVENFTALTVDDKGNWDILKWPEHRKELVLKGTFNAVSDPSDKAFRPQTKKMIAAIQKIWPGRAA